MPKLKSLFTNNIFQTISFLFSVLAATLLITYLVLAWTEPTQPPPGGNVPAPINVGPQGQSKAGGLILNTGGAPFGLIVQYGNVGIGTTAPAYKLDVVGPIRTQTTASGQIGLYLAQTGNQTSNNLPMILWDNPDDPDVTKRHWIRQEGNILVFKLSDSGTFNNVITNLAIAANGNVGIGTTAPGVKLDVAGVGRVSGLFQVGGTDAAYNNGRRGIYVNHGASTGWELMTLENNNGVMFKVLGNGNVGIGTTSPGAKLDIVSGGQRAQFLTGTNTSGYTFQLGVNDDGVNFSNNSTIRGFNFKNANGTLLTITSGGNVGIGATNPATKLEVRGGALCVRSGTNVSCNTTSGAVSAQYFYYISDLRLKQNIQPIDNALSRLLTLQGISYETIYDKSRSFGLIAQEVEKVFPEVVSTDKETGLKWIDYGKLTPVLIEAIKEQQREIERLKAEIELLKTK